MSDVKTLDSPTEPRARSAEGLSAETVIGGRFTLERLAGHGGMGEVYLARDGLSGAPVALKLLHGAATAESSRRFQREAALLSQLAHPGLVAYVAHGTLAQGQPYLVMRWLEGEDLSRRLAREPLWLPQILALMRRVTEALSHAHARGIVHRDLKPSNLFLCAGRPEDAVVLDFGLARELLSPHSAVTGSHTVVGSPGYMAPEQASGQTRLTPAADIFSLGCVLYECLAGQPPFEAPHFAAALAKILFAEPPSLRERCPDVPEALIALVERMLAKEPSRRPADAAQLLEALAALPEPPLLSPARGRRIVPASRVANAEQRLVSVLLFSRRLEAEPTLDWAQGVARRDSIRAVLEPLGAQVELLADGSFVATLSPERGSATDQAVLAARCALLVKERWPEEHGVLTTGLGVLDERLPVGEAMDRAGRLLRRREGVPTSTLLLDAVTAGLLGPGFQLSRLDPDTFLLHGEQDVTDTSRPLMGKPTSCVGREQELTFLDVTLSVCIEEASARAVLVTAAPGVGKSRLRHEFLRRLARGARPVRVLWGRGEPVGVGTTQGLLGQALRRWLGLEEGTSLAHRRAVLHAAVTALVPEPRRQEALEFLGELCDVPVADEDTPRLRAARSDPRLMGTRIAQALVALLGAECARQPVLLVLEDLHWSDALTVQLVDEALRALSEQPLFVLALARPEVRQLFPGLWPGCLQELRLKGLSRKAGGRLVREVLGVQVSDSVVDRVVEQSDGNALLLEELIRGLADGRGEAVPETVLAVLQLRVSRMAPETRRVLLAASFFGHAFWAEGVRTVLDAPAGTLDEPLRHLLEQEIIGQADTSRFSSVSEYRFRHALVRDAVLALVPEAERAEGHRRVGAWLEAQGEPDALVLATHFQQGGQLERAAHGYTLAADRLFERNDFPGMERCVEGALACGVSDADLARLRGLQCVVAFWSEQVPRSRELGLLALHGLRRGGKLWCLVAVSVFIGTVRLGLWQEGLALCEDLSQATPEPGARADFLDFLTQQQTALLWLADRPRIDRLHARIRELRAETEPQDFKAWAWIHAAQALFQYHLGDKPWTGLLAARESERYFQQSGAELGLNLLRGLLGAMHAVLGDAPGAVERLRAILAVSWAPWQHVVVLYAEEFLLDILSSSAAPEALREARVLALGWHRMGEADVYRFTLSHVFLARLLAADGALDEAEAHCREACARLAPLRSDWTKAQTLLSSVLLRRGKVEEAWEAARLCVEEVRRMRGASGHALLSLVALVEACFARNDIQEGEAVLREALACVRARASDIPEPRARARFLGEVPVNARVLALARERWGDLPDGGAC
ncbi:serine/threonine-protein kinase [Archangium primigenium]|uniref:serine/threonine-protein kinase n=1 Tax=[Archangium] primigenium TaxID=2792470 RepID=UPI0019568B27|nr:serine/threonine-protein kinase [Archangium primigenium]MBM7118183.1 protein kinase [Archangium primigenium]